ncbi:hypothetical protein Tco_0652419 [Tanacetum coccineum]|uniref:Uncharacterized protein n=1 Tax=Tanacetum coccineum TaxID=301880 RepID=A0ABQ4WXX2_9ASTR
MPPKKTTTPMFDAAIKALVARSVADALAKQQTEAEMEMTATIQEVAEEGRRLLLASAPIVMAIPTIPVSTEENLRDPIDIRVDIIHPEPVVTVAFLAVTVVRTLAQHEEAIRGMQGYLLGVPIQEELTALRFRVDIAEAEKALLRARIKTTEAIKKITHNIERHARIKIEQQLVAVQESHRQDREDFRMLKEL